MKLVRKTKNESVSLINTHTTQHTCIHVYYLTQMYMRWGNAMYAINYAPPHHDLKLQAVSKIRVDSLFIFYFICLEDWY